MLPPVLILHANGTNRCREAAWAVERAGGAPEIVHMNRLTGGADLRRWRMIVLPGGFSYGDDLGAGKLWALLLRHGLGDSLDGFVASGRPVLGICNGFQALVKSGLLRAGAVTLTRNASARFECRWVRLEPVRGSRCVFTRDLDHPIDCPVAHGEGRFVADSPETLGALHRAGQVALRYAGVGGAPPGYPANPNGSADDIAGICNPAGNVLGLMPHPEDHLFPRQAPRGATGLGLPLFAAGIRCAAEL